MPILIVQLLPLTSESEEYFRCVMEAERQNFSTSLGQGMAQERPLSEGDICYF